jgi:ribosome-binding factor A
MSQRNSRQQRIESQMQRALAQLLTREVKDPRVGRVTITAVSLVPDLSAARVWFLPFGLGAPADEALEGLRSAAGFLRGEVARQLGLRHAPRLEFLIDTQLERAQSRTELIDKAVASDRKEAAAGADGPPGPGEPEA